MRHVIWGVLFAVTWTGCSVNQATPPPLVAERGTPTGEATRASIGPAGGTLTAGALTVTVPPGAFAAATPVSATPVTATAPGASGQAWRLEPEGTTFAQPVTLTWRYEGEDVAGSAAEALLIAFQHRGGVWAVPGAVTLNAAARTVSVQTTHFSDWALVQGVQFRPGTARVKVGAALGLRVVGCYFQPPQPPIEELGELIVGYDCDHEDDLAQLPVVATDWSVNGVTGGSDGAGRVTGQLARGTYTAPQRKPKPDTVAVSARVDGPGRSQLLIVSNVTITEGQALLVSGVHDGTVSSGSFANATVVDEGIEFELPFPVRTTPLDVALPFQNRTGNRIVRLWDERTQCMQPVADGSWDMLTAASVTHRGAFAEVVGEQSRPAITLGVGEGDCTKMSVVWPARQQSVALGLFYPNEITFGQTLPEAPIIVKQGGWTWTYTPVK